jgi:serine phosphatase RsbU (regulator of sigma subunit)
MTQMSVVPAQPGPGEGAGRTAAAPRPLRVLLVEDDDADAFLVRELLDEGQVEVDLIVARTLAQAIGFVSGVDCVLLDLGLPDAQGLDGLRRLLAVAGSAAVCVLTGLGDDRLGAAAVAEGAQDYLFKGQVDGTLLARSVRYAVERKRADENARRLHEVELQQQESARLERGLLPQPLLRTDALRVHTFYQPGRHSSQLGGDFYDVVQTSPDRIALVVGDVCGHGVDEAALGVELRVAWRALVLAGVDDDAVLPAIEQVLISERAANEVFATLAMVTVNLADRQAWIRLAGHPPPLLIAGGDLVPIPHRHGPVLGIFDTSDRPAIMVALPDGDWTLVLYTDGLIDGRTGNGDERLEVAGLRSMITSPAARDLPREELPRWLVTQAEAANEAPFVDDVAMLVLTTPTNEAQ